MRQHSLMEIDKFIWSKVGEVHHLVFFKEFVVEWWLGCNWNLMNWYWWLGEYSLLILFFFVDCSLYSSHGDWFGWLKFDKRKQEKKQSIEVDKVNRGWQNEMLRYSSVLHRKTFIGVSPRTHSINLVMSIFIQSITLINKNTSWWSAQNRQPNTNNKQQTNKQQTNNKQTNKQQTNKQQTNKRQTTNNDWIKHWT